MTNWHVIFSKSTDQNAVRKLLAKYKCSILGPIEVTRMIKSSNGLLVHNDPEWCFSTMGPDNLDEKLKDNKLINAVLKAPKVYAC